MKHFAKWAVLGALGPVGAATAADLNFGDEWKAKLSVTLTAGTMIRTEDPDPRLLGTLSAPRVGLPPGQLGGNSGRADLNFRKNDPVSTVTKGVVDFDLRRQDIGIFLRARAWHDYELEDGNRAYGNSTNGFRRDAPLSDNGFAPSARFSNAQFMDAYVYGGFGLGDDRKLDLRVGRQTLDWGVARLITGGIDAINPSDTPSRLRPGALAVEGKVPVGMIRATLAERDDWGLDGFVQYEFRPNVIAPCGTFFDAAYYAAPGCAYVSVLGGANVGDVAGYERGLYPKRNPDDMARDSGQFGVALRYQAKSIATEFRGYAMNYHSRSFSIGGTNPNINGGYGSLSTFTRLTDPNGLRYTILYAEDIRLLGASFTTQINPGARWYGEISYRPNQPLNINPSDLIAAFVGRSPNSALNLAKGTNAIPPGGTFEGYDRYKTTTAIMGLGMVVPDVIGAERLTLVGEAGWSHVRGLPDAGVLRYGRSDDFGVAAINGLPCVDTSVAQKTCAHQGFVTTNAWGYRLQASASYPGAIFGATLKPSVFWSHDVSGYSYDYAFQKGRRILRPGLRAEWNGGYFVDVQYARISGGDYNTQIDRDNLTLVAGIVF